MNKNKGQKQVSLAGVAKTQNKKTERVSPWKWIGIALAMIALLVAGILLFDAFDEEEKPSLSAREMVEYTYTSDALAKDVSYYLLGVTGPEIGDPMDMLAVMCYDRKSGTISVVQMPVTPASSFCRASASCSGKWISLQPWQIRTNTFPERELWIMSLFFSSVISILL